MKPFHSQANKSLAVFHKIIYVCKTADLKYYGHFKKGLILESVHTNILVGLEMKIKIVFWMLMFIFLINASYLFPSVSCTVSVPQFHRPV